MLWKTTTFSALSTLCSEDGGATIFVFFSPVPFTLSAIPFSSLAAGTPFPCVTQDYRLKFQKSLPAEQRAVFVSLFAVCSTPSGARFRSMKKIIAQFAHAFRCVLAFLPEFLEMVLYKPQCIMNTCSATQNYQEHRHAKSLMSAISKPE